MLQVEAAHLEALRVLHIGKNRRSAGWGGAGFGGGAGPWSKAGARTGLQQQPLLLVPDLRLHLFVQVADLAVVRRGLPVGKQISSQPLRGGASAGPPRRRGLA